MAEGDGSGAAFPLAPERTFLSMAGHGGAELWARGLECRRGLIENTAVTSRADAGVQDQLCLHWAEM